MPNAFIPLLLVVLLPLMSQAQPASPLPALRRTGPVTQLIVDGKPFLMLAGELHNSSASSPAYMEPIWKKLVQLNLNTVIGTASWELVEPEEDRFDFTAVDAQILAARKHDLRLVLIWFASWKNASSSYVPMWVKLNPQKYPLMKTSKGKPGFMGMSIDALTPLGEATLAADASAFKALMRHIREVDLAHTVILIQVENETGLLGDSRDRSPLAEAAWNKAVPPALLSYLEKHKTELLPELSKVWGAQGFRTSGTWAEVFGSDAHADEVFMAWYVGRYVGQVAAAGKTELALPMYANAWLGPQPRQSLPGQYPSGGPVTGMLDVWRAAAPALDLFAPDIYVADFAGVCAGYRRSGNTLFIPEARASAPNLFWAVGREEALGYSPFGIEDLDADHPLAAAYEVMGGLWPVLSKARLEGKVVAAVEGDEESVKAFEDATGLGLRFGTMRSLFAPPAAVKDAQKDMPPAPSPDAIEDMLRPPPDTRGFVLALRTAGNEFYIAGSKALVRSARAQLGTIDEGRLEKGNWIAGRRLNGDESISSNFFPLPEGKVAVRKVRIYHAD